MKIRLEIDPETEEEIVFRCKELTPEIMKLEQLLTKAAGKSGQIVINKDDTEYYMETD